jgi:hypothetical protein
MMLVVFLWENRFFFQQLITLYSTHFVIKILLPTYFNDTELHSCTVGLKEYSYTEKNQRFIFLFFFGVS